MVEVVNGAAKLVVLDVFFVLAVIILTTSTVFKD